MYLQLKKKINKTNYNNNNTGEQWEAFWTVEKILDPYYLLFNITK